MENRKKGWKLEGGRNQTSDDQGQHIQNHRLSPGLTDINPLPDHTAVTISGSDVKICETLMNTAC